MSTKPVPHDSDHRRPPHGLKETVQDPDDDVDILVVEVSPLKHHSKHKYLDNRYSAVFSTLHSLYNCAQYQYFITYSHYNYIAQLGV